MATILWILAVVLVIAGIVQLFQGQVLLGIVLIVLGFLVGPGGVSIFAAGTSLGLTTLWPVDQAKWVGAHRHAGRRPYAERAR
jgi:hypothetical protein